MHKWRTAPALLAALCFCYYILTMAGHHVSIDGMLMFQQAKALAFQHSLRMTPPVVWGGTEFYVEKYGVGLSLVYVLAFALLAPLILTWPGLQAIPYMPAAGVKALLFDPLYTYSSALVNPAITAATAVVVYLMGQRLGLSRKLSVAAALVFGLASPAATYARFDFSQPLASLCVAAAVLAALSAQRTGSRWAALGAGASAGFGVLTRPDLLALVPWIALLLWGGLRRPTRQTVIRLACLAVPVAASLAGHALITYLRFGQFFDSNYGSGTPASMTGFAIGAVGLLASPYCGLIWFFPLSLLAPSGLRHLARGQRSFVICAAGICLTEYVIFAAWGDWFAGVSWGPRYLLPTLPYLSIGAAAAWPIGAGIWRRRLQALWLAALAWSFLASVNGMVTPLLDWFQWLSNSTPGLSNDARLFRLIASPLLTGWRIGLNPATTDLIWRPALAQKGLLVLAAPIALLVAVGMSGRWLRQSLALSGIPGSAAADLPGRESGAQPG